MERTNRKMLINCISVLTIVLLVTSATNTVADVDWGNLKSGDEMIWHWTPGFAHTGVRDAYYELEILEIGEESLTVDHHRYNLEGSDFEEYTIESGTAILGPDDLIYDLFDLYELTTTLYWIYPVSMMRENENIQTKTIEFNGNNYKAAYLKEESSDYQHEFWWDYNTGILFQYHQEPGPASVTDIRLEYTNADLTETTGRGFCLGTILIAFVSLTTLLIYSFVQYKKKKNV
ncbi:MAG: hypothetical protein ACFE96_18425 [Candidatus Hermodarchaeota archaeon]